jgi:hypothetical protein
MRHVLVVVVFGGFLLACLGCGGDPVPVQKTNKSLDRIQKLRPDGAKAGPNKK